ncbi:GGDEF domain-containing protein [Venenivibrio stagnispumantis]|uniref:diguanylate cyclase n=1 Tax=Venenivibrio stagnispumantis TaxID=407998 RepID=A0AA46AEU8_9AQUI|nr:GGDEF domain-containing protein [Venenivibrio stagnispumantis]MCW4573781.1 diguanylate cyclase [Venenivibrio stagnispumantis]SMP14758.1 diguanylate cyclase [Venenivibrio stagnispumantis]
MDCKFLKILNEKQTLNEKEIKFITDIAKESLKIMVRNKIPLIPDNFEKIFIVFCHFMEQKKYFADIDVMSLYKNFLEININKFQEKENIDPKKLEDLTVKIGENIEIIKNIINKNYKNLQKSEDTLQHYAKDLSLDKIDEILEEIKKLRKQNATIKNKIEERQDKIKNLKKEIENAKREANIDFLTGLYNRRSFFRALEDYFKIYKEKDVIFSIILFDIDHFKKINDTYGHDAGDLVLIDVASVLKSNLKSSTISGRIGGEEFGILMLDNLERAVNVAEMLRRTFETRKIIYQDKTIKYTASFGVTQIKKDDNIDSFLKRADELLYFAKKLGRNTVVSDM